MPVLFSRSSDLQVLLEIHPEMLLNFEENNILVF